MVSTKDSLHKIKAGALNYVHLGTSAENRRRIADPNGDDADL